MGGRPGVAEKVSLVPVQCKGSLFVAGALAIYIPTSLSINMSPRSDVLMLAVDDLRPELSCVDMPGYPMPPRLHTPNICALAAESLVLGALPRPFAQLEACMGGRVRHGALQPFERPGGECQRVRGAAWHRRRAHAQPAPAEWLARQL